MLIAMMAQTVIAANVVACPPGCVPSEGEKLVVPQAGELMVLRKDDPAPGKVDCMGHAAGEDQAAALAPVGMQAGRVSVSEAPYGDQFADPMLNKTWVTTVAGASVKEFAAAVGRATEREVFVDWERLSASGISPETKIAVPLARVHLEAALRIVNERLAAGGTGGRIAARRTGDLVEISTQDSFDRREQSTVAYDIRTLLAGLEGEGRAAKIRQLTETVTSTVDPEGWAQNGGATSRSSEIEGRVFVVAPPRVQKAVAWVLGQLGDQPMAGADVLRKDEPVQILHLGPVPMIVNDQSRDALQAELKRLRRELAWKKSALGEELTAEDRAAMDDSRAVRAIGPADEKREVVSREVGMLAGQTDAIRERLNAQNTPKR